MCIRDSARAVPVGRLDRNSEGLLLLTDDGELLYRLTHPAHEVEKCYLVTLRGAVEDSLIEALGGELFLDGEKLKPVGVRLLKREPEKDVYKRQHFTSSATAMWPSSWETQRQSRPAVSRSTPLPTSTPWERCAC